MMYANKIGHCPETLNIGVGVPAPNAVIMGSLCETYPPEISDGLDALQKYPEAV